MRSARIAGAMLIVLVIGASAQAALRTVTVDETTLRFKPDTLVIHVGDIVQWVNPAGNIMGHTSTSGTGSGDPNSGKHWNLGPFGPGTSVQHRFTGPGTYPYYCIPHELSGMKAQIIVLNAVDATGTGAKAALVALLLLVGGYAIWKRRAVPAQSGS